jgi:hypothetical protein
MDFKEQDRQLRFLVARASSPCFGQAGSLSYHFEANSTVNAITDFVHQISLGFLHDVYSSSRVRTGG